MLLPVGRIKLVHFSDSVLTVPSDALLTTGKSHEFLAPAWRPRSLHLDFSENSRPEKEDKRRTQRHNKGPGRSYHMGNYCVPTYQRVLSGRQWRTAHGVSMYNASGTPYAHDVFKSLCVSTFVGQRPWSHVFLFVCLFFQSRVFPKGWLTRLFN